MNRPYRFIIAVIAICLFLSNAAFAEAIFAPINAYWLRPVALAERRPGLNGTANGKASAAFGELRVILSSEVAPENVERAVQLLRMTADTFKDPTLARAVPWLQDALKMQSEQPDAGKQFAADSINKQRKVILGILEKIESQTLLITRPKTKEPAMPVTTINQPTADLNVGDIIVYLDVVAPAMDIIITDEGKELSAKRAAPTGEEMPQHKLSATTITKAIKEGKAVVVKVGDVIRRKNGATIIEVKTISLDGTFTVRRTDGHNVFDNMRVSLKNMVRYFNEAGATITPTPYKPRVGDVMVYKDERDKAETTITILAINKNGTSSTALVRWAVPGQTSEERNMSLHAIVEKAKKEGTQITPSPYVPRAGDIIWSGRGTKRTVNLVMNGGDKIMVNRTDTSGCVQENLPLLVQNVIEGMVSGATDRIERDGEVIFSFAPPSIDAPAPLPALLPQAVIAASVSAIESNI